MRQNIFDDETFFAEYMKLRHEKSYNDLLEQPAMRSLLPDVRGKAVLDIGCGYGRSCFLFAQGGAEKVVGIDLSEKMLNKAAMEYSHPKVEYRRMDMADLSLLPQKFDLAYSSLAFHYAEDFQKLSRDVYRLLNGGGRLLFSQEHPIVTASAGGAGHHNLDQSGRRVSYTFSDYAFSGRRTGTWLVEGVVNYHRPMSEIVSTLAHMGFVIEDLAEPVPDSRALRERPDLEKEFIKPTFLIIRARK